MSISASKKTPVLASQLYDAVTCRHRIFLDATLDRSRRTPPDPAAKTLFEHGNRFEAELAAELDYPEVVVEDRDWNNAAAKTTELMRSGVEGIYQGVLIDDGWLAQPDFMRKVPGESSFGDYHYQPGDAKSALHARSDAALQVGFAGLLLEKLQRRLPEEGFLILGDRTEERFGIGSILATLHDVTRQVEEAAAGMVESVPFFCRECLHCRWRGHCLKELRESHDCSFVYGLTRSRHQAFRRAGIVSIEDLAAAQRGQLMQAGAPVDGLDLLRRQAGTLLNGRVRKRAMVETPVGRRVEFHLDLQTDPLDGGAPFLFGWGVSAPGAGKLKRVDARLAVGSRERAAVFEEMSSELNRPDARDEPVFHYGTMSHRALEFVGEELSLDPAVLGRLEARLFDLAPRVRRASVLPVYFYDFEEVAAVALGLSRPDPEEAAPSPFLQFHALAEPEILVEEERERVARLAGVREWLGRLA